MGSKKWKPLFGTNYWLLLVLQLLLNKLLLHIVTTSYCKCLQLVTALWSSHIGSGKLKLLFCATYWTYVYFLTTGYYWFLQVVTPSTTQIVTTNADNQLLQIVTTGYCTVICTYRVRKIETTLWPNLLKIGAYI